MTVENTNNTISYTGNGSVDTFAYNFLTYSEDHLKIYLDDELQTSGYSVEGIGSEDGGNVIFIEPPSGNVIVNIQRIVPLNQLIEYQEYGPFPAKANERGLDLGAMADQQLNTSLDFLYDNVVFKDEITNDTKFLDFNRYKLNVIPGETLYPLPDPLQPYNVVLVDGKVLPQSDYDASNEGFLILSDPINTPGLPFEVWNRVVTPSDSNDTKGTYTVNFLNEVLNENLSDYEEINTLNGVDFDDNYGNNFSKTGFVLVAKANSIDVNNARVYDVSGNEFKLIGEKVRLETLGVPYDEVKETLLNYLVALRDNGFDVELSPRYSLTDLDSRKNVQNNVQKMILHRGLEDYAPENTMLAFSIAVNSTVGQNIALEIDVQITSDGIPVIFHDLSLDVLTTGTGRVIDVTYAYLQTLKFNDLLGTVFEDDVKIPTLDMVMEYVSEKGIEIYPETKSYRTIDDVEIMVDVISKYEHTSLTRWNSFKIVDLQKVRQYAPESPIGFVKQLPITQTEINGLVGLGGDIEIMGSINFLLSNPVDRAIFRSYGWSVAAWTLTRYEQVQEIANIGIHKYITDRNLTPSARLTSITSPILFDNNPWGELITGDGTIVYSSNPQNLQGGSEVVVCEAGTNSEATVSLPFNVTSGEVIEMTVFARNYGGHPQNGVLDVNRPTSNRKNTVTVINNEMMEYKVNYQAPWLETFACYEGIFELGCNYSRDSGVKLYRPIVASTHSGYGSNRVIMQGCIVLAFNDVPGNHVLDPDTLSSNISEIITNGPKLDIRPQRETQLSSVGIYGQYPFNTVSMADTGQDILFLSITADSRFSTSNLRITCRDSDGLEVDLSTLAVEHRVYFKVEM